MDNSHYSNVINNNSYPSSASSTPHSLQPTQLPPHTTLPPLQHNSSTAMQAPPYSSYQQSPRTPATPNTPGSTGTMGNYPPPPNNNGGRPNYQMMPNNSYQQPHQQYPTTTGMMPQSSAALSHPQPIAPAPSPGSRVPPVLRPMPTSGVMQQGGIGSPYGSAPMMQQPNMMPDGDQPTHVVGSQGRRGILPSAPGRPAAPPAGTTAAKAQIPQKDADGKFPCPHCTKTYLHAKHLKRHLLRHTGDRPYMCVLCRDTFSRSDILKRHFQKCSIRRGNPTGASHLSHPHAHVKKNAAAQQKALGEGGDMGHMNGMSSMPGDMVQHQFGLMQQGGPEAISGLAHDQTQLSRSNSMQKYEDGSDRDRRNVAGSVPYNGSVTNAINPNINPQLSNYNMPSTTQNGGMPQMFAGQNSSQQVDWAQMFPQQGPQSPTAPTAHALPYPYPNLGQTQIATKQEPNVDARPRADASSGQPYDTFDDAATFGNGEQFAIHNFYQQISTKILNFLLPLSPASSTLLPLIQAFFSADSLRDVLPKYSHFQTHFALLHTPTFRVVNAYAGLVVGMCCIAACYSDRIAADQVREIMDVFREALVRDSRMLASLHDVVQMEIKYENGSFGNRDHDMEELQAIILMQVLFLWNGTPQQREKGRKTFPRIAALVRKANLMSVIASPDPNFSLLHQPNYNPQPSDAASFDWAKWIEQEKRNHIMHAIFTQDTALGLFFNDAPLLHPFEINLPLQSDDAAWEANSALECAEALGLYGPEVAHKRNPSGTKRPKQPEVHLAVQALMHTSYQVQPGPTNLMGKFILIHALIALIRSAHKEGHGANSPWGRGSNGGSANNSGRGTPTESTIAPQTLKSLITALDKFKRNWDADMAEQFPPASSNPHRHGFSRDGVHYYWLANYLLKNTRQQDLQMSADRRFMHVIHLLKSVKTWVETDAAARGEELGSIAEIDMEYGVRDLTLDMVNLFKPLPDIVISSSGSIS